MLDFCTNETNEKTKQQKVHSQKNQKKEWGIQNSQLPRNNNQKINDMREKKGE
jgi:hypothetical protein